MLHTKPAASRRQARSVLRRTRSFTPTLELLEARELLSGETLTAYHRFDDPAQALHLPFGTASLSPNTGGLRIIYPLDFDKSPGTHVGGNPALIFDSATLDVRPVIEATLATSPTQPVPSQIQVRLTWNNGTPSSWTTFSTSGHQAGDTYLLAAQVGSAVASTGAYPWQLDVKVHYSGGSPVDLPATGTAGVVVRDQAGPNFGPGWGIAGLDRLVSYSGGVLWVYGAGGSRVFPSAGGGSFTSPANDFGSLIQNGDNSYTYTAKDQTKWHFNSTGLLTRKVDTHNLPITYTYDGNGGLTEVRTPDGAITGLSHNSGTGGQLVGSISQPGRTLALSYDSDDLVGLEDGDGSLRTFSYDSGHRLTVDAWEPLLATYSYDGNGLFSDADRGLGATLQLTPALRQGLTTNPAKLASQAVAVWTDALNQKMTMTLDGLGRETKWQTPDGATQTWQRDQAGQVTVHTDALNRVTTFQYQYGSGKGDLVQTTFPDGSNHQFQYHSTFHHLTRFQDSRNNVTTFAYDAATGDLLTIRNALNQVTTQTWSNGLLQTVTDPLLRTTSFLYDSARRLQVTINALGGRTTVSYDTAGNVSTLKDALSRVTTLVHDARGRLVSQTDASGATATLTYLASDLVTQKDQPLGICAQYTYDQPGRRIQVTNAVGMPEQVISTSTYDALGRVTSQTDGNGNLTTMTYDPVGRLRTVKHPNGGTETFTYDAAGQLIAHTDELNRTTSFTYNNRGWLIAVRDPLNQVGTTVYDTEGNVTARVDPLGFITTLTYDALNRLLSVQDPGTGIATTVYDAVGNVVTSIDALGQRTTFVFDALNRLVQTIDARNGVTTRAYDAVGNLVTLIDPVNNRSTFVYDAVNRMIEEIDPLGHSATYAYDQAGRLESKTNRNYLATDYTYDHLGRMLTEKWRSGPTVLNILTFTYDDNGNVLTGRDDDSLTTLTYDTMNRLKSHQSPYGKLDYTYDLAGQRTKVKDTKSGTATSVYDAAGRLTSRELGKTGQASIRIDLSYNARSNLTGLARNQGPAPIQQVGVSSYTYDAASRLSNLQHKRGETVLANYTHTYDVAHRLLTETLGGGTKTFTYDVTNQLTGDGTNSWSYDLGGNRTNSGYQTGTGNRLTTDGTWNYTYDEEDNRITKTHIVTGEYWYHNYDQHNRLDWIEKRPSAGAANVFWAAYTYDVFGNRIQENRDPDGDAGSQEHTVTRFLYDGAEVWADLDVSNNVQVRYLRGDVVDQLFARLKADGTAAWYLTDRLGSVRDLTDASGVVQDHLEYDGFGNVTSESNPAFGDRYKWTGREFDAVTGLQYNRARYYDPKIGRWISEDPIRFEAGDSNPYRYVFNRPTSLGAVAVSNAMEADYMAADRSDKCSSGCGAAQYQTEQLQLAESRTDVEVRAQDGDALDPNANAFAPISRQRPPSDLPLTNPGPRPSPAPPLRRPGLPTRPPRDLPLGDRRPKPRPTDESDAARVLPPRVVIPGPLRFVPGIALVWFILEITITADVDDEQSRSKCCVYECTNTNTGTTFRYTRTAPLGLSCPSVKLPDATCTNIGSTPGPCPFPN
jgi:RHS repeat-associated protein